MGFSSGVENIPIQKNPGSFNREFLTSIDEAVNKKEPILIFPEGNWYDDFDVSHEMKLGAAHIAKKYNLKIVPAYIKGASSWKEKLEVDVSFGEYFSPDKLDKKQISEKIALEISKLQQKLNNPEIVE